MGHPEALAGNPKASLGLLTLQTPLFYFACISLWDGWCQESGVCHHLPYDPGRWLTLSGVGFSHHRTGIRISTSAVSWVDLN